MYCEMILAAYGTLATLANVTKIVPVEFASFSASVTLHGISLEWTTASELNNNGFEIERSVDGNTFVTIGFVDGKGTSTETNYYSFADHSLFTEHQTIYYRLKQVDFDGTFSYSNTVEVQFNLLTDFVLNQNYPNPFNPSTTITYTIPSDEFVDLRVYNMLGKEIAILEMEQKSAGSYKVNFNASDLPNGVYFYSIKAGEFASTMKMMLVK